MSRNKEVHIRSKIDAHAILYDGLELGVFERDENDILHLKLHKGIKKSWLPYIFELALDNNADMDKIINIWIKERVFPKNRINNRKLLKDLGLKRYNITDIVKKTHCSLITDPYWVSFSEDDMYNEVSARGTVGLNYYPYNSIGIKNEEDYIWRVNKDKEITNIEPNNDKVIYWRDKELIIPDSINSHANGGRLEKFWVQDRKTGRQFLIKGSTSFSYEPYCEKIAYIIGRDLGIDVLEYDIIPAKEFVNMSKIISPLCKHVSICEKIDRVGYSITSVAEIKRAKNAVLSDGEQHITNKMVMEELFDKKYLDTMLLFDAIIGNTDRHYGNVHLLRDLNGEFSPAPLLDNGASLLATATLFGLLWYEDTIGQHYNSSKTISRNHAKQIKYISTLKNINYNIPSKTIQILHDIQPVLDEMPKYRYRMIKKYITLRLHKYLGMLKRDTQYTPLYFKPLNFVSSIRREQEHT